MDIRALRFSDRRGVTVLDELPSALPPEGWVWIDVTVENYDDGALDPIAEMLELDGLAVHDAVNEIDLPKVDDFGHHLLIVLHGLCVDRVETYEIDIFLTRHSLLTVRAEQSPAIDSLWNSLLANSDLGAGGADELAARLADVATRRLLTVVDAFDDRVEAMVAQALEADPTVLGDVAAMRADIAEVRRVVHPQRESLDLLRHSPSTVLDDHARRRFSDVFDVATRATSGLEAARSALAEALDAYRGAEAREATEVSRVLTVYAAVMLPLSLIAGFFGMNHPNLPGVDSDWGWVIVTLAMAALAAVSLGVFVSVGWIRRPSGREAGATLGRGLAEAARAPVQLAGALYEISTMPLRGAVARRSTREQGHPADGD